MIKSDTLAPFSKKGTRNLTCEEAVTAQFARKKQGKLIQAAVDAQFEEKKLHIARLDMALRFILIELGLPCTSANVALLAKKCLELTQPLYNTGILPARKINE